MKNTTFSDVIDSFESSFMDKKELPIMLEIMWFKKAVGQFSTEIEPLSYDEVLEQFDSELSQYVVDILGAMIKIYYLERELSRVNKIASIVGRDISVNGTNGLQKYTENELNIAKSDLVEKLEKLKPSAYN